MQAGVAVNESGTWHVVVASLRHLAKAVVVVLIHSSHCNHRPLSHLLQQQPCRRMDAVGERASHLGDAAAQPCVVATLADFSCAHTGRWPVHRERLAAWRARTVARQRPPTASHAILNDL